ncbi:Hint domain-containing protein [Pseudoxanthobacter sp. M-2]|uniref:Hint domain-containing protein n=1 Tax=Pseudoxanthobacter sp. M-2 TaxID=3078754 RepID=UPI0038FCB4AC
MTTVAFAYHYVIDYTGSGQITEVRGSGVLDFDSSDLAVGDPVLFVDNPWIYAGQSNLGEPYLTDTLENAPLFLLSNTVYQVGDYPDGFNQTTYVPCFLAGTRIAVPGGEVAVETLRPGDLVLTADGRSVPVRWIGRRALATPFVPEPRRPVCIAAGALGDGLPTRDLRLTPDHALFLDGLLVQAGALVNGAAVRRMSAGELGPRFEVFHVETAAHELILAEGVAAETFVDNVARQRFDNHAEAIALCGDSRVVIEEMALPRIKSARQLPRSLRARLRHAVAGEAA